MISIPESDVVSVSEKRHERLSEHLQHASQLKHLVNQFEQRLRQCIVIKYFLSCHGQGTRVPSHDQFSFNKKRIYCVHPQRPPPPPSVLV